MPPDTRVPANKKANGPALRVILAAASVPDIKYDRDANLQAAAAMVQDLAAAGAQVVVLPEGCLQGYIAEEDDLTLEKLRQTAEPFDGKYATAFRALAKEARVYLVTSYDRLEGDAIYNSAELIGPDGESIGVYDKTHSLPKYHTPGKNLPVFDTEFGKMGILICADRSFAENWRVLMLAGASMVLISAAGGYSQLNTHRLQARACDQCLPNVFAHPKRALVINLEGDIVDQDNGLDKPYAIGEVDLSNVRARQKERRQKRRPDLYGPLAAVC